MKKNISKRIAMLLGVILIPVGTFGFGYFYAQKSTEKQVAHTLTVDGSIEGSIKDITENNIEGIVPGDILDKTINIKPNATADSLLRVKIKPYWVDENNNKFDASNIKFIYAGDMVDDELNENKTNYWYKADDGYLYYMNSVTSSQNVIELVKGMKFLGGTDDEDANNYQGKTLKVTVNMDMIQCKYGPYKSKWNVTDENLYSKLAELCPENNSDVE